MKLYITFDKFVDKGKYEIAQDSTWTDNFSDDLDSAVICIDQVANGKRLYSKNRRVSPYDYVYVESDEENDIFPKYMLVDSIAETICNIDKSNDYANRWFRYEVHLMSETKLLEKIQLPNRCITHSLATGQKTILQVICEFCELYLPKVKVGTSADSWEYAQYINNDYFEKLYAHDTTASDWTTADTNAYNIFNVSCPDMTFNNPTLRMALTQIMQVTGCIPTVKNRTIKFLNFQEEKTAFKTSGNGIVDMTRGISSDSYVNELDTSPFAILDTTNEAVEMGIGFRDMNAAIVKKSSGLYLTTRYPMYHVNKLEINNLCQIKSMKIVEDSMYFDVAILSNKITLTFRDTSLAPDDDNTTFSLKMAYCTFTGGVIAQHTQYVDTSGIIFPYSTNSSMDGYIAYTRDDLMVDAISVYKVINYANGSKTSDNPRTYTFERNGEDDDLTFDNCILWFSLGYKTGSTPFSHTKEIFAITGNKYYSNRESFEKNNVKNSRIYINTSADSYTWSSSSVEKSGRFYAEYVVKDEPVDITPVLKTSEERAYLSQDYRTISEDQWWTGTWAAGTCTSVSEFLNKCSQNYYTTIQYTVTGNTIDGWSTAYSEALAFISNNHMFVEDFFDSLVTVLNKDDKYFDSTTEHTVLDDDINGIFTPEYQENLKLFLDVSSLTENKEKILAVYDNKLKFFLPDYVTDDYKSMIYPTFNVYYNPLISTRIKYNKENEDIPLSITQMNIEDGGGISSSEYLFNVNQEKTNKCGEDVLSINQRSSYISDIQPLNSCLNLVDEDNNVYTVYSRTMMISKYFIRATYNASENFVLQHFFTAIQTKYRATENVGYGQTIERKESNKVFAYVGSKKLPSSLITKVGYVSTFEKMLFYAFLPSYKFDLKYVLESTINNGTYTYYVNPISIMCQNNILNITYKNFDSVSAGLKLDFDIVSGDNSEIIKVSYTGDTTDFGFTLGGFSQSWVMYPTEEYFDKHKVLFTNDIITYITDRPSRKVKYAFSLPEIIYDNGYIEDDTSIPKVTLHDSGAEYKTYYKDNAEVLNETFEVEYVPMDDDLLLNVNYTSLLKPKGQDNQEREYAYYWKCTDTQEFNKNEITSLTSSSEEISPFETYSDFNNDDFDMVKFVNDHLNIYIYNIQQHTPDANFLGKYFKVAIGYRDVVTRTYLNKKYTVSNLYYSDGTTVYNDIKLSSIGESLFADESTYIIWKGTTNNKYIIYNALSGIRASDFEASDVANLFVGFDFSNKKDFYITIKTSNVKSGEHSGLKSYAITIEYYLSGDPIEYGEWHLIDLLSFKCPDAWDTALESSNTVRTLYLSLNDNKSLKYYKSVSDKPCLWSLYDESTGETNTINLEE